MTTRALVAMILVALTVACGSTAAPAPAKAQCARVLTPGTSCAL